MKTLKINNILISITTILLLLFLVGCDSDLVDINDSPNAISDGNVKTIIGQRAVLISLQATAGDWYSADRSRVFSIWTRQMCAPSGLGRPQPVFWNDYAVGREKNGVNDYNWKRGYNVVKLANDIIDNAAEAGLSGTTLNAYLGIAKFYKTFALGEHAAVYGKIPIDISDAFPRFVSQTEAYAEVIKLINEAIAHFIGGTATVSQDLNFTGNGDKWIEASNSLKARYLLHKLDYAGAATAANLGITAAANTVFGKFSLTVGEYAPWGHFTKTEAGEPIRANKYYVDKLKDEPGDTRLTSFFSVRGTTEIIGFDVYKDLGGTGDELSGAKASGLNKYGGYNASFPLISYQENLLIRAEALARTTGVAAALPDLNTIRTGAGLTAKSTGDFADAAAIITAILNQKYIQLHLEGQAYNDMRRVNKTDGRPLYRTGIPYRLLYPESETTTNPNVPVDDANTRNELW